MPVEQDVEVGADDLVEEDEAVLPGLAGTRGSSSRRGSDRRHLDPGEAPLVRVRVPERDRDRERQARDVRERMARVDGERREDGVDLGEEALAQRCVVLRSLP